MVSIENLTTLVFSGGGVRGLAYAGALMAFKDTYAKDAHDHFSTFAGSSVGSLFALVCSLGLNIESTLALVESMGLQVIFQNDPACLLSHYALNSGEALESLLVQLFTLACVNPNITFQELNQKTGKSLVVVVVDLLTSNTMYLDHTNEGQKMSVLKALMGSMALPPMFPPVKIGSEYLFTDGGLLDNFPIARFEPSKTLGIRSTWYIDPTDPMNDIASYYTRVLSIMQLTMHSIQQQTTEKYENVILIDLGHIMAYNTNVNQKDLIFKGYRSAIARFSGPHILVSENPVKFLPGGPLRLPAYLQEFKNAQVPNV